MRRICLTIYIFMYWLFIYNFYFSIVSLHTGVHDEFSVLLVTLVRSQTGSQFALSPSEMITGCRLIGQLALDLPSLDDKSPVIPLKPRLGEDKRKSLMHAFKSASVFPPFLHSAQSLSRRNMDTTCFRGAPRFPPRAQPNSFSIDWILSSGHRKPGLGGPCAYTQPHVLVRGAFCPSGTNRPLAAAASFGPACVYTPHFYHRHSAAYRNTPVRLQDGKTNMSRLLQLPRTTGLNACILKRLWMIAHLTDRELAQHIWTNFNSLLL